MSQMPNVVMHAAAEADNIASPAACGFRSTSEDESCWVTVVPTMVNCLICLDPEAVR